MSQLALPLRLADHAVFESFWPAGNEPLVAYLERLATGSGDSGCWLWGPAASGKTHLLQAACQRLGDRAVYLPMTEVAAAGPGILEGSAAWPFVCIDSLERVAGDWQWEHALFALWNGLYDTGGTLLVAARASARESGLVIPDLQSRMSQLTAFHVRQLPDAERVRALQLRARHRGLELPNETASYLLSRKRRDMASLYSLLDRLDAEALRAKRRLTVPFVKTVLPD